MFGLDMAKVALVLSLVVGLPAMAWLALHEHDKRVLEQQAQAEKALTTQQQVADQQRIIAGLSAAAQQAQERAAQAAAVTEKINAAPKSKACVSSAPVRALLDSLRRGAGAGPGATPTHPGQSVDVPGATAATR